MITDIKMEENKDIEAEKMKNGGDNGPIVDDSIDNGGGDDGLPQSKIKSKICTFHVNALPFIPSKEGVNYVKEDLLQETPRNDDLAEPIESVPNGLTIKCNPKIWRSISSDKNNLAPMKQKSMFTLSSVNAFLDCQTDNDSLKQSNGQLDSSVNLPSATVCQACSTPHVLKINAPDINLDLPRERRPSHQFEIKPSRSDFVNFPSRINESSAESNYQYESGLLQSPSRLLLSGRRNNIDFLESPRSFGPIILPNGTIKVRLRNGISVDMTLDKAVCVIDSQSRITISLSCNGSSSVMVHPNGKVHQIGTCVEIVAYDGIKRNNYVYVVELEFDNMTRIVRGGNLRVICSEMRSRKSEVEFEDEQNRSIGGWEMEDLIFPNSRTSRYSKLWHKGISFTSESSALVYLVDSAGTRTTSDNFADMRTDYSIPVFLAGSRHGPAYIRDAVSVIGRSTYWCSDDGTEEFYINDFRIIQTGDGVVNVVRPSYQWLIRTSFRNCCATLTTPQIHCTASLSESPHLFVRRQDKRVHFDGYSFVVRNASQSAGFDENNLLKVY